VLLVDPSPDAHVRYGLILSGWEPDPVAFEHLAVGMAGGDTGDSEVDAEARTALESMWADQGTWDPLGLDGYLASLLAPVVEEPGRTHFPDLGLHVDGKPVSLADFPGPVVVDLWATWCGPCQLAIPHMNDIAERYAGRVTVLVVSVDDSEAKAVRYLSRGQRAFSLAWAGPNGTARAGEDGIPAMFVLDAEHRIVERFSGYTPGDRRVDVALEALVGP
jgi:thiol-disulfide isomerase/thioredoxin